MVETTLVISEEEQREIATNRARYAALKAAGQKSAPKALPGPSTLPPPAASHVTLSETVPAGWYRALRMKRGETLRIINSTGTSAVSFLCWNAAEPTERFYHGDTVKVQWSARLQKGRVLLSEMGRVLVSITEDSSFAHDALVGCSTPQSMLERFGRQGLRNGRENLLLAASKHGLGRRDVAPCVTFFAPVTVGPDGRFLFEKAKRRAGDFVDLRAEMDLLVALSNTPHPLDPAPLEAAGPIDIIRFMGAPPAADDPCRTATAEAVRAFENTDAYLAETAEAF